MNINNRFYLIGLIFAFLISNIVILNTLENVYLMDYSLWISILIVINVVWLVLFLLVFNQKEERKWMKWILSIVGIHFALLVLIGIDKSLSQLFYNPQSPFFSGIIYPPNVSVKYKTIEFEFEANINKMGLRDHEYSWEKKSDYRILTIGDSFTYGWGVSLDDNYENVLEESLREEDVSIEILNLGQPGGFSIHYKKNLEKAIDLLKPDLVILGLLQGDDLRQMITELNLNKNRNFILRMVRGLLFSNFKNLKDLHFQQSIIGLSTPEIIQNEWKNQVREFESRLNPAQKRRYSQIDSKLKYLFENGEIDPYSLRFILNGEPPFMLANRPSLPISKLAKEQFEKDLSEIKSLCEQNGNELLLINIPHQYYIDSSALIYNELSISKSKNLLENNKVDSIYQELANAINTPIIHFTKLMKSKDEVYYKYDGHFNEKGHQILADSLKIYLITNDYFNPKNETPHR